MRSRLALLILALATLFPTVFRAVARVPAPPRDCPPAGRGEPPLGWVGCEADPGPGRELTADERLAFGLPVDLNRATAEELARVPGLSPSLARAVIEDRERRGRFPSVEALRRVRGIGDKRLAQVRNRLAVR